MADRGTFIKYEDWRPNRETEELLGVADAIIQEYEAQGLDLTLRQLYYQFVARDVIPNTDRDYKRLAALVSRGRMAGLLSWTAIQDRTRNLMGLGTQSSPAAAVRRLAASYRRDLWADQLCRLEVWIEKEAMVGPIQGICNELRVDFFACRGYNSQSEQWRAGRRFANYVSRGQRPIVLHLGDHDPSGLDMTRDNRERLEVFAGVPIQVIRIALNMDQIEEVKPPPNPAKDTDARFDDYAATYGTRSSWELDSLSPRYIRDLIDRSVRSFRDDAVWDSSLARELSEVQQLEHFADSFKA